MNSESWTQYRNNCFPLLDLCCMRAFVSCRFCVNLCTPSPPQAAVDAARESINRPREAFRQKFLEAERKRQEEIAAQEAALLASQEKAPSPKGRKSAKGKKSAGKKKK